MVSSLEDLDKIQAQKLKATYGPGNRSEEARSPMMIDWCQSENNMKNREL